MNKKLFPYIAIAYVLVFLFIQVIAEVGTLTVESLIQHETLSKIDPIGTIIAAVSFSLVTIALFLWMKWATVSRDFIMTRPWDLLFWCFIAALGVIIPSTFLQEQMPEWPDSIQRYIDETAQQMVGIMNTPGGYAVICLLAPIAEELVFRGAVLRKLIVPGIIFHWANNTVAYLLIRIYQDPDITITQIFGSQSRVLMAVGFSLLIFLPAIYQLNQRLTKKRQILK